MAFSRTFRLGLGKDLQATPAAEIPDRYNGSNVDHCQLVPGAAVPQLTGWARGCKPTSSSGPDHCRPCNAGPVMASELPTTISAVAAHILTKQKFPAVACSRVYFSHAPGTNKTSPGDIWTRTSPRSRTWPQTWVTSNFDCRPFWKSQKRPTHVLCKLHGCGCERAAQFQHL